MSLQFGQVLAALHLFEQVPPRGLLPAGQRGEHTVPLEQPHDFIGSGVEILCVLDMTRHALPRRRIVACFCNASVVPLKMEVIPRKPRIVTTTIGRREGRARIRATEVP